MASSVSGVNSSAVNSLYGNRNVISGLASGMDTESMIENAVSGIKTRISKLGQKRTTWEWKQEAYRSIIDKMAKFNQKYTSFNSATNLFSNSFFSNSVITSTNGSNASKVSATGKTSSNIRITDVTQLATAGGKTVGSDRLGLPSGSTTPPVATAGEALDLEKLIDVSNMSGSMTLTYGTKKVSIDFGELDIYDTSDPQKLANAISEKLSGQKITLSNGKSVPASLLIDVKVDGNKIAFSDKSGASNSVFISGATGDLKDTLKLDNLSDGSVSSIDLDNATKPLAEKKTNGEYLSGKTLSVTVDGKNKTITLPTYDPASADARGDFMQGINDELKKAFGYTTDAGGAQLNRVSASLTADGKLAFTGQRGSTIQVTSAVGKAMGLGDYGATSYLNMGTTLGDLKTKYGKDIFDGLTSVELEVVGKPKENEDNGKWYDEAGNEVAGDATSGFYRVGKDGNKLVGYEMKINGETIGTYTRDTAMDKIMSDINNNTNAGVNVTYSKTTSQFVFSSKETGSANGVTIEAGGLAESMFGTMDEKGKDAILSMEVNGVTYSNITRSDNSFDVDGLKVRLEGTFTGGDAVTFSTKTDSEKIMTAIKDLVKDYNEMMSEVKDTFDTLPAKKANKTKYEPLTDADRAEMSESAIEAYEEKAKQGILFADSDLSSLYSKMTSVFTTNGSDGGLMRSFGIDTVYSADEGTTLTINETKLKAALENNLDGVRDLFTKTKENGAATNGIMSGLKTQLDNYASTTGEPKGLLIQKAGSPHAPTSILKNTMQTAMNDIDEEVERWENKLSDQVDRYTRQFSRLEQLVAQMNSQSSSLMSLMGGTG